MKDAFDEIYRKYAGDVYHYLLGLSKNESVSMDILQDTMLKAIESIDSFQQNCSMKTWLCTIARNEYYNYCKRPANRSLPLEEAVHAANDEPLEHRFADQSQAMSIHRLLHQLDEPYREIFTLRVFAELRFSEIGSLFGKSENWARVTFFRAKSKIIALMQEQEASYETSTEL
ncbi:MAG: sigma-70 family RNA polymerase sigma factor [Oscillospiraceae bacterium]|nr:sigma-70 family RNA polymerase sigma factor [Oscillospiraceae bacterium]MBQ7003308.1 sigma-70 family RNA polymerase sigma factor [Oscillospiraceae bacterium]